MLLHGDAFNAEVLLHTGAVPDADDDDDDDDDDDSDSDGDINDDKDDHNEKTLSW